MRLYYVVCLALFLAACGAESNILQNQVFATGARVKFVHTVVDGPGVNVFANDTRLNGTPLLYGATFPAEYSVIPPGATTIKVATVASGTVTEATILTAPVTLEADKYYSIVVTGAVSSTATPPTALLIVDDQSLPDPSKNYIRVINLVTNGPGIDLAIGAADPLLTNIPRNTASAFVAIEPNAATGPYSFQLRSTGTKTLIGAAFPFNSGLVRGRKLTLVVRGAVGRTGAAAPTVNSYTVR